MIEQCDHRLSGNGASARRAEFRFPRQTSFELAGDIVAAVVLAPSGPRSFALPEEVKQQYCDLHPDFEHKDSNERRVDNLIAMPLTDKGEHELPKLARAIEQGPLHQEFSAKQAVPSSPSPARASSVSRS